MSAINIKTTLRNYILIIIGTAVMAFATASVLEPASLITGGFTGIAIIVKQFTEHLIPGGIPLSVTNLVLNIPLFLITIRLKGFHYLVRTIFATLMLSFWLSALPVIPLAEGDLLLSSLYGGIFMVVGIVLGLLSQAPTGGTELIAALICRKSTIVEGIRYVQALVDGSMTMLLMTKDGIYAARDRYGRTPLVIGRKEDGYCVSFESFAYIKLGYTDYKELGPAEIAYITPEGVETVGAPGEEMKICSFLWVYYGYPTSSYEGVNVEEMRYKCGSMLAKRDGDSVHPDVVAGVPDSGVAHAIGYANESGIPYARPFIKYTPTWPRSFMPTNQSQRNLIARMKLIPVHALIENKKLLLIDDSIVRGTQLRETTEFLYQSGAKEVHVRPACPPIMYGCKYLNFSRSKSEM